MPEVRSDLASQRLEVHDFCFMLTALTIPAWHVGCQQRGDQLYTYLRLEGLPYRLLVTQMAQHIHVAWRSIQLLARPRAIACMRENQGFTKKL